MEATLFTGWIYDHLVPQAQQVKAAHPVMLRAVAAAKKKMIALMPAKSQTVCPATSCPNATWFPRRFATGAAHYGIAIC